MSSEIVEGALKRSRALLSEERAGELREVEPEKPPESLGALAGVGFEAADHPVRVSVYVIPDRDLQAKVGERLSGEHPEREGFASKVATNGPMLFFGRADTSGPDGLATEFRLAEIVSAFSGDE